MQFKSVRITSNLMAPSRALDAAHVLLYRGAVTKRLRSGCDDSSLPNYKSIPPTWAPEFMNRSNTIKYYSGSPVDFCISGQLAISTEAAGTSVFFLAGLDWKCPTSSGDPSLECQLMASSSQRRLMSPVVSFFLGKVSEASLI